MIIFIESSSVIITHNGTAVERYKENNNNNNNRSHWDPLSCHTNDSRDRSIHITNGR